MKKGGGVSLLETILALVILATALLLITELFHRALSREGESARLARAALVAESALTEIRTWAEDAANYDGTWAIYDGTEFTSAAFPAYKIRVDVQAAGQELLSPCSRAESLQTQQRKMARGVIPVRVRAGTDLTQPGRCVELVTYVGAPKRDLSAITVTRTGGASDPVPPDETVEFEATALDGSGNPIPDAFFSWRILALTGNGTLLEDRDGRKAKLQHVYQGGPTPTHRGGVVRVEVELHYHGAVYTQASADVTLQ